MESGHGCTDGVCVRVQKEKEAHAEAEEKARLEAELREQRRLIDALSAETMVLREEVTVLQVRLGHLVGGVRCPRPTENLSCGGCRAGGSSSGRRWSRSWTRWCW